MSPLGARGVSSTVMAGQVRESMGRVETRPVMRGTRMPTRAAEASARRRMDWGRMGAWAVSQGRMALGSGAAAGGVRAEV